MKSGQKRRKHPIHYPPPSTTHYPLPTIHYPAMPRIKTTRTVKIALFALCVYLAVMLTLILLRFLRILG